MHLRARLDGTGSTWSRHKFSSFKTSVAVKSMVILQNVMTTNHRKSGRSKKTLNSPKGIISDLGVVVQNICSSNNFLQNENKVIEKLKTPKQFSMASVLL